MTDMRTDFNVAAAPRDARLNAALWGEMVHAGRTGEAFAAADEAEPGSQLPMLMALARDAVQPNGTAKALCERLPFLNFWYSHDFIVPLMDGSATGGERFFENTRMTPRDKDDAFIIKAAVVSPQAESMVPYLLDLGPVDLNTRNDRPVTLAVLLGKGDLLPLFAESGADLYAARSEAFRLARQQPDFGVYTALQAAAKSAQKASQRKLMQRAPRGLSPAVLRAGDDETGLHLAAKAGMIQLLLREDLLCGFTADDFLKPSKTGATAADILAAAGEHAALFDERIWGRRFGEAEKLYSALDAHDRAAAARAYDGLMRARDVERQIDSLQARWPSLRPPSRKKAAENPAKKPPPEKKP